MHSRLRGHTPFGQDQELRPVVLVWPDFLSMRKFLAIQICQIWWKVSINNVVKWSYGSSVIVVIILRLQLLMTKFVI